MGVQRPVVPVTVLLARLFLPRAWRVPGASVPVSVLAPLWDSTKVTLAHTTKLMFRRWGHSQGDGKKGTNNGTGGRKRSMWCEKLAKFVDSDDFQPWQRDPTKYLLNFELCSWKDPAGREFTRYHLSHQGNKAISEEFVAYTRKVSMAKCNHCQRVKYRYTEFTKVMNSGNGWPCPAELQGHFPDGKVPVHGPEGIRLCMDCVWYKVNAIQQIGGSGPRGQPSQQDDADECESQWRHFMEILDEK